MTKPLLTIIREALRARLLESEALAELTGGRISLNRGEPWAEGEATAIGVYAVSEEPINTDDLNPDPPERKLNFTVEILTREDGAMEERLDLMAALVENLYDLPSLDKLIKAAGGQAILLKIAWQGSERGYAPEAEVTLGALVMAFSLEYRAPWPEANLPDLEEVWTDIRARGHEGARARLKGQVNYKEDV